MVATTLTLSRSAKSTDHLISLCLNAVNTIRVMGKVKLFRGKVGQRSDYKKAIVTLAEGEKIDVTTGV